MKPNTSTTCSSIIYWKRNSFDSLLPSHHPSLLFVLPSSLKISLHVPNFAHTHTLYKLYKFIIYINA